MSHANVNYLMSTKADGNQREMRAQDAARVKANRLIFQARIGRRSIPLKQVHGIDCLVLDSKSPDGFIADASLTTDPSIALEIQTGDCLPVLFWNDSGTAVAAAHAGWRGLCGNDKGDVLQAAVVALRRHSQPREPIHAWLGACIGPKKFEVGQDVVDAFIKNAWAMTEAQKRMHFKYTHADHTGNNKYLADLLGLATLRLKNLGVSTIQGNDGSDDWCTVTNSARYFSYRREGAAAGRMNAAIWIERD